MNQSEPKKDTTSNPPGERSQALDEKTRRPQGPGEPSPGLKDKDAPTSDTYGNTRESGEEPK